MNRLEMISLFTAMKHLVKTNNQDAVLDVIDTVLREANVKDNMDVKVEDKKED